MQNFFVSNSSGYNNGGAEVVCRNDIGRTNDTLRWKVLSQTTEAKFRESQRKSLYDEMRRWKTERQAQIIRHSVKEPE